MLSFQKRTTTSLLRDAAAVEAIRTALPDVNTTLKQAVGGFAPIGRAAYTASMRIVGAKDRSEIELDPVQAHKRGLAVDAMLKSTAAKRVRGVFRGTHAHFNRIDAARQVLIARELNAR